MLLSEGVDAWLGGNPDFSEGDMVAVADNSNGTSTVTVVGGMTPEHIGNSVTISGSFPLAGLPGGMIRQMQGPGRPLVGLRPAWRMMRIFVVWSIAMWYLLDSSLCDGSPVAFGSPMSTVWPSRRPGCGAGHMRSSGMCATAHRRFAIEDPLPCTPRASEHVRDE